MKYSPSDEACIATICLLCPTITCLQTKPEVSSFSLEQKGKILPEVNLSFGVEPPVSRFQTFPSFDFWLRGVDEELLGVEEGLFSSRETRIVLIWGTGELRVLSSVSASSPSPSAPPFDILTRGLRLGFGASSSPSFFVKNERICCCCWMYRVWRSESSRSFWRLRVSWRFSINDWLNAT